MSFNDWLNDSDWDGDEDKLNILMSAYNAELERQVKELEAELKISKSFHDVAVKERNYERNENKKLREALKEYPEGLDFEQALRMLTASVEQLSAEIGTHLDHRHPTIHYLERNMKWARAILDKADAED